MHKTICSPHRREHIGIHLLSRAISTDATHDSPTYHPRCHAGTRKVIIEIIMKWIEDQEPSEAVIWLHGLAGHGKSAILQSVAELCESMGGQPAASFFFSKRASDRNKGHHLFCTIAYQLATNIPTIRSRIDHVMRLDPALPQKSIQHQFQKLVLGAFQQINTHDLFLHSPTIIIDGLDECEDHDAQQSILSLILDAVKSHSLPLRFLIASRPEPQIVECFSAPGVSAITRQLALDDSFQPYDDIRTFLNSAFLDIRKRKGQFISSDLWPGSDVIEYLVSKSSGQFIYVSTVVKFVDAAFTDPVKQLDMILRSSSSRSRIFLNLDVLYSDILSSHPDLMFLRNLFVILLTPSTHGRNMSIFLIEDLLGLRRDTLLLLLGGLFSLLEVRGNLLSIAHTSFQEYMYDKARSGPYYINIHRCSGYMATICLTSVTNWILNPWKRYDTCIKLPRFADVSHPGHFLSRHQHLL